MALPKPEPGLVISFNYLWRREAAEGAGHGRYSRPCVIVVAVRTESDGGLAVVVAPMTTKPPVDNQPAVQVPPAVKRHVGLDPDTPSWVVVDEVNEFGWPGFDLEPNADGRIAYGFVPQRLYERIRTGVLEAARARRLSRTQR